VKICIQGEGKSTLAAKYGLIGHQGSTITTLQQGIQGGIALLTNEGTGGIAMGAVGAIQGHGIQK